MKIEKMIMNLHYYFYICNSFIFGGINHSYSYNSFISVFLKMEIYIRLILFLRILISFFKCCKKF